MTWQDGTQRCVIVGLLSISLSALPALAASEPYRDKASLRTTAACAGVTSRMAVIIENFSPPGSDPARVEEDARLYERASVLLIAYLAAYQHDAGVSEQAATQDLDWGLNTAGALFKSKKEGAHEYLALLAQGCYLLSVAVDERDPEKMKAAFDLNLKAIYPHLPQ